MLTVFCSRNSCYIAESEGRSANKEIEQYLKKRVAEYESEFGTIEIENN